MACQTHRKLFPHSSRFLLLFSTAVFITCLVVFVLLAYHVVHLRRETFDRPLMLYFYEHRYPALVRTMRFLTFFGSGFFLLPAYMLLVGYLWFKRLFREALAIAVIAFLSWLFLSQLKVFFHRHRPDLPLLTDITTYSFPSAHAFSSLIFFSILSFVIWKSGKPSWLNRFVVFTLLLLPVFIGLSRIVLNVHYPTDVLAGYCLATMWLILSYGVFRRLTPAS